MRVNYKLMKLIYGALWAFTLVEAIPQTNLVGNGVIVAKSCLNYTLEWDFGCGLAMQTASYMGSMANYTCLCSNQPFLGTFSTCAYEYVKSDNELSSAFNTLATTCKGVGTSVNKEMFEASYENATKYIIDYSEVKMMVMGKKVMPLPVHVPITVNDTAYRLFYNFENELYYQMNSGTYYGLGLVGYFLVVLLFGMIINFCQITSVPILMKLTGCKTNLVRRYITLPPTFKRRHSQPGNLGIFSWMIPTRIQSIVIGIYLIMNLIFISVDYRVIRPNNFFYYQTTLMQICKFLGYRSGIISFTQLPLLFLFGGRNNFMMWLTGWSFNTFNAYHRWIARATMFHAFVHSIAYSMWYWHKGSFGSQLNEVYFAAGIAATVFFGALWIQSFAVFRRYFYEAFLVLHILFVIGLLITIWYHCVTIGWMEYIYCAIAIWAFDRLARLVRITRGGLAIKSSCQLCTDGTFRVDIPVNPSWNYYPGCHTYIYFLNSKKFWQSHPFTVFKSQDNGVNGGISLHVKPVKGITADIASFLSLQPGQNAEIRTMVEGPYGYHHPVSRYQTAVFISGGIGVTASYPYMVDLIGSNNDSQRIVFIWIIRNKQSLESFQKELDFLFSKKNVEVRIFITASDIKSTDQSYSDSCSLSSFFEKEDVKSSKKIVKGERPNITEELVSIVTESDGPISVLACGPPSLNDTVRLSVIETLDTSPNRIDYFEEAFSW